MFIDAPTGAAFERIPDCGDPRQVILTSSLPSFLAPQFGARNPDMVYKAIFMPVFNRVNEFPSGKGLFPKYRYQSAG
jgi:hypothetical protein